jgi:predicted nucleic acid-binding protein
VGLKALFGEGPIGLDASLFIYFIERHPEWRPVVRPIFKLAADGERQLVTSELTLLEVLVVPFRSGNFALAGSYQDFLQRSGGLSLVAIDRVNLRNAANLRARYGIKTADSLQLAAALSAQCTSFITNDRKLPEIAGLKVIQLSDLR